MAALHRCPHCGGGVATLWSADCCNTVYAVCTACGTRTKDCSTPKDAADIWNERFVQLVNIEQILNCFNDRKQRKGWEVYGDPPFNSGSEVYTEINRLKYKLFDMKCSSTSREEKAVLDRCIEMVDSLPIIRISRGESE